MIRFEGDVMVYLTIVTTSNNKYEILVGMIKITYKGYNGYIYIHNNITVITYGDAPLSIYIYMYEKSYLYKKWKYFSENKAAVVELVINFMYTI